MLRVTVEADVAGIGLQGRAKCEFCVPAVERMIEWWTKRSIAAMSMA